MDLLMMIHFLGAHVRQSEPRFHHVYSRSGITASYASTVHSLDGRIWSDTAIDHSPTLWTRSAYMRCERRCRLHSLPCDGQATPSIIMIFWRFCGELWGLPISR